MSPHEQTKALLWLTASLLGLNAWILYLLLTQQGLTVNLLVK